MFSPIDYSDVFSLSPWERAGVRERSLASDTFFIYSARRSRARKEIKGMAASQALTLTLSQGERE
jgi:hypothetical protein